MALETRETREAFLKSRETYTQARLVREHAKALAEAYLEDYLKERKTRDKAIDEACAEAEAQTNTTGENQ